MNVADLRKEYTKAELTEDSVDPSPIKQFKKWFDEAIRSELLEPNAMILSTVNEHNIPFPRSVLLKAFDERGFVFYTNYRSRKASHISQNSNVSLLFPWYGLERQVAIIGKAEKVTPRESLNYFMTRPKGSQLGAWVSHQSQVISSRSILEVKLAEMKEKFAKGKIPLPDFWGGYRVIPKSIEFWQGRKNRLHDRILFEQEDNKSWKISRLSP